jgi:mannose-1-phosphate guanylyltransferase
MELIPEDSRGNRVQGDVWLHEADGNFIISNEKKRPLLFVGLRDCIVVNTKDGVLICHKETAEQLKPLVQQILDKDKKKDK